jgi:hypothetical protein
MLTNWLEFELSRFVKLLFMAVCRIGMEFANMIVNYGAIYNGIKKEGNENERIDKCFLHRRTYACR